MWFFLFYRAREDGAVLLVRSLSSLSLLSSYLLWCVGGGGTDALCFVGEQGWRKPWEGGHH